MDRVAIFVDAGYLFAQGSAAISGSQQPRSTLVLNEEIIVEELIGVARLKCGQLQLLRIYWYDGALGNRGLTAEQTRLASLDNVKVRLGFVNGAGQQKGVDSLIVTDLIELARNRAIIDAIIVSGDEDIRIGVQIAQNFGVRVHLLGIEPSRGSQSPHLINEADTVTEWNPAKITTFLTVHKTVGKTSAPLNLGPEPLAESLLDNVAEAYAASLEEPEIKNLAVYMDTKSDVPPEFDGKLLAKGRDAVRRDLLQPEKRRIRKKFLEAVKKTPSTA